jgi:hypothetical protein
MRKLASFVIYRVPLVMPALLFLLGRVQYALLSFYKDPEDVRLIRRVTDESNLQLQPQEAHTLLSLARMQSALDGDMAEVGLYRGGSAKLICTVKGPRTFWGFDTFAGLKDVSADDTHWGVSYFKPGAYAATQSDVEQYLAGFPDVQLRPGFFPESAGPAADRQFSFVHLDVDTYGSTLASLRFFWPRMVPGGIVITHDSHAQGVSKAVTEFTAESGARSFPTTCSQLAFIK